LSSAPAAPQVSVAVFAISSQPGTFVHHLLRSGKQEMTIKNLPKNRGAVIKGQIMVSTLVHPILFALEHVHQTCSHELKP
jgi:hypothetical protein